MRRRRGTAREQEEEGERGTGELFVHVRRQLDQQPGEERKSDHESSRGNGPGSLQRGPSDHFQRRGTR